jgi:hypothetical protein
MTYRKPRTLAQLKADPRVADVWTEFDGYGDTLEEADAPSYWVGLHEGWLTYPHGTNSIHTKTVKAACEQMGEIYRVIND